MNISGIAPFFSEDELQDFEQYLSRLTDIYADWFSAEINSDHPSLEAAMYFRTKLATAMSLLGDIQSIREG